MNTLNVNWIIAWAIAIGASISFSTESFAVDPPSVISHQGRITVGGVNFNGTGFFKFALVDTGATTTYWNNDLSQGAMTEPLDGNAAQVTVVNGHYAVGLGDTALTNMGALDPDIFADNADVNLRIWFSQTGAAASFEQLTPDIVMNSVGFSLNARKAQMVPDGSITEAMLATTFEQAGAVETVSGLDLSGLSNNKVTMNVTFGTPFTTVPAVNVDLTGLGNGATAELTSVSETGFTAVLEDFQFAAHAVAAGGGVNASGAIVNGNPAVAYSDTASSEVRYAYSSDPKGAAGSWTVVTVDTGVGSGAFRLMSLAVVDGKPAISYIVGMGTSTYGELRYARSTAVNGASGTWSTATVVGTNVVRSAETSLAEVNGKPALTFVEFNGVDAHDFKFAYSSDAQGGSGTWTEVVIATRSGFGGTNASQAEGRWSSLKVINGNPAIAFENVSNLEFAYSTDPQGIAGTWTNVTIDTLGSGGQFPSLTVVNGNPAIAHSDPISDELRYVYSSDPQGLAGTWTVVTVLRTNVSPGEFCSLAVVGGKPSIAHFDEGEDNLLYSYSSDVQGVAGSWSTMVADDRSAGHVGSNCTLFDLAGTPGISYRTIGTSGGLLFAILPETVDWDAAGGDVFEIQVAMAQMVAPGGVTAQSLAANSVTTAALQAGSVTESKIGVTEVSGVYSPSGVSTGSFTIPFGQTFGGEPLVTFNETPLGAASIDLENLSTSDFTGTISDWATLSMGSTTTPEIALAEVNGAAAMVYISHSGSGSIRFRRAGSAAGNAWSNVTFIDSFGNPSRAAIAEVNGVAAVAVGNNIDLEYYYANDITGDTWTGPIVVNGAFPQHVSMAVVDGNPAIAFDAGSTLRYARATDAAGTAWAPAVTVHIGGLGDFLSLEIIDGNPAISYRGPVGELTYVRATDTTGTAWGAPVAVASGSSAFYTNLVVSSGRPAIAYRDNGALKWVRANDATGDTWGTPVIVDDSVNTGVGASMVTVGGVPAISYSDVDSNIVKYVYALNNAGTSWSTPEVVYDPEIFSGGAGALTAMAEINGRTAFLYEDDDLIGSTPIRYAYRPDIEWTAQHGGTYAVTAASVQDNGVTADALATDSVTSGKIAAGAVSASELAADAVTSGAIVDGSVAIADIGFDHGDMGGLLDDDHPQYLRTDGARALTGSLSAGGNKVTNLATATVSGDALPHGQVAGGDLGGSYPSPAVDGLQGRPISAAAPAAGEVLVWGGVFWEPQIFQGSHLRSDTSDSFTSGTLTLDAATILDLNGQVRLDSNEIFLNNLAEVFRFEVGQTRFEFTDDAAFSGAIQTGTVASLVNYNRFGSTATSHALSGTSDVMVSGDLEVNAVLYADNALRVAGDTFIGGTVHAGVTTAAGFHYFADLTPTPNTSYITDEGDVYIQDDLQVVSDLIVDGAIRLATSESLNWDATNTRFIFSDDVAATSFIPLSDRNAKEDFETVDPALVLEKIAAIPITTWKFKEEENEAVRHIGPVSQDFYKAFGFGADERRITTTDADGVALAAIQALKALVDEKDSQIKALEKRLEKLEKARVRAVPYREVEYRVKDGQFEIRAGR